MYNLAQSFNNLLTELNIDPLSPKVDTLLNQVSNKIRLTASNSETEVKLTIVTPNQKHLVKQLPSAAALLNNKGIELLYKPRQQKDIWILAKQLETTPVNNIIKLPKVTDLRNAA